MGIREQDYSSNVSSQDLEDLFQFSVWLCFSESFYRLAENGPIYDMLKTGILFIKKCFKKHTNVSFK